MRSSTVAFFGLLVLAMAVTGCGIEDKSTVVKISGKNMDMQHAATRADFMLDSTIAAVRPMVYWTHGETTTGSCDLTRRRAVMTQISERRRGNFLGVVERFWKQEGYVIKSVNRSEQFPAIYAQSSDGFGISLSVGVQGQIFFEVDTPCVKESPVSEATTPANGPDYRGGPIPRPNVHDDFWSSPDALPSSSPAAL